MRYAKCYNEAGTFNSILADILKSRQRCITGHLTTAKMLGNKTTVF